MIRLGNAALECTTQSNGYVLHTLLQINDDAVHFQRDVNGNWSQVSVVVAGGVTEPPSIGSSWSLGVDTDNGYTGTIGVITSGSNAVPFFRAAYTTTWTHGVPVSSDATTATCAQSSCMSLPAVIAHPANVEDILVLEGSNLVHYTKGNARNAVVSTAATGAAMGLYTPYRPSTNVSNNIDALILEGSNMVHYWMDGASLVWTRGPIVSTNATGPACMIVSAARSNTNDPGNFEALIPEGSNLVHYWRNNSDPSLPWAQSVIVSSASSGPASLAMGGYGDAGYPNFEALVQEGDTVYHYWRNNSDASLPWIKDVAVASG
jgi:hypothetical protein